MRKFLILLLSIFLSHNMMAQLEVKEGSFKEVEGFVNINTEIMYDDNDKPYAVLKVKTENINDKERHQLLFQGDARTFFELEYKVGEVWVYLSYYASYLKISHPDFGSTEFWFPFDMYGKKGYELTLINKPSLEEDFMKRLEALENATAAGLNTGEYGYVVIKTTPVNGATILIDGEEKEMKTPFVSDKLSVGPHRIRVVKEHYKPYVTVVEIEEGKTKNIDVEMKQAYGNLEIVTHPKNVNIKLNRIEKGKTPQTFNNIPTGNYKIELNKNKYQTISKDVVVKDGETAYVDVDMERIKIQGYMFVTVNAALNQYNDISYGLTFGSVKKIGLFVSGMSNFNFQGMKYDYECDNSFYINSGYPEYTGVEAYTRLSLIGGVIVMVTRDIAIRTGAGYGVSNAVYGIKSSCWVKNTSASTQGLEASLGLQCKLHGFIVSMEIVTTNFKIYEAKIGLGYGFKNK